MKHVELQDQMLQVDLTNLCKDTNTILRNEYVLTDENGGIVEEHLRLLELGSWLQYQLENLSKRNILLTDGFKLPDHKIIVGVKYPLTNELLLNIKQQLTGNDKLCFEYIIDYLLSNMYKYKYLYIEFITIDNIRVYNKIAYWQSPKVKLYIAWYANELMKL
jgi:hypothetical protein